MKKTVVTIIALFSLFFFSLSLSGQAATGDIRITNQTSSKGLTGHIAIQVSDNLILHTSGWSSEPWLTLISINNDWERRYNQNKIIRYNSDSVARSAVQNAMSTF